MHTVLWVWQSCGSPVDVTGCLRLANIARYKVGTPLYIKTMSLTYKDFKILYKKNNSGCIGFNQIWPNTNLNNTRVDSTVRVPEAAVITPLPADGICLGLRTSSLQQAVHWEDPISWQSRHQLSDETSHLVQFLGTTSDQIHLQTHKALV